MTHNIENIGHHWSGETLYLTFVVYDGDADADDVRKNLEGASVTWELKEREGVVLDDSDPDVTPEIITPTEGELEVRIEKGATDDLGGQTYDERLQITDSDDRLSIFGAQFTVSE